MTSTENYNKDWSLDQYKLLVDHSQKIKDTVQSANSFYVTVNSVLISGVGTLLNVRWLNENTFRILLWLLIGLGFLFSMQWYQALKIGIEKEKKHLAQISRIEKDLTFSPFSEIYREPISKKYTFIFKGQRVIPILFSILYLLGGVLAGFIRANLVP